VESFSSDGPRRIFFTPNGIPITPGNFSSTGGTVRQKPDIAAADGVRTATPGFNPFFGTSAAAPHAAAIAALLEDTGNPTPAGLEQIFAHTALDIEASGFDRDSGWGLLDAEAAVGTTNPGPPDLCYVDDLILNGVPNDGPQTFRACLTITAEDGTFNEVTFIADNVILAAGFKSAGPLSVKTTTP
jgi:subtilisin family serine protease